MPISPAPDARGGAWLDDDTIVLAPGSATGLWTVQASGGTPALPIERGAGEIGLKFPAPVDRGRDTRESPRPSATRMDSTSDPRRLASTDGFAVVPDGTRFLVVVPTSRQTATVKVTRNWRPTT